LVISTVFMQITKHKMAASGVKPPGTFQTFMDIYRKEGIRGINRPSCAW
jgi:hypothetical protein